MARSATRDFRAADWKATALKDLPNDGAQTTAQAEVPAAIAAQPYSAVFAEIDILKTGSLVPLRVSSDVFQWKVP